MKTKTANEKTEYNLKSVQNFQKLTIGKWDLTKSTTRLEGSHDRRNGATSLKIPTLRMMKEPAKVATMRQEGPWLFDHPGAQPKADQCKSKCESWFWCLWIVYLFIVIFMLLFFSCFLFSFFFRLSFFY
jgi:hypothetical protein